MRVKIGGDTYTVRWHHTKKEHYRVNKQHLPHRDVEITATECVIELQVPSEAGMGFVVMGRGVSKVNKKAGDVCDVDRGRRASLARALSDIPIPGPAALSLETRRLEFREPFWTAYFTRDGKKDVRR